MKLTKTIALAAVLSGALFASNASFAQDAGTNIPPKVGGLNARPRPNPETIAKELALTDEQKPKFKEIMQGAMEKRKALREDNTLSQEEKRAKAKEIQENTTKELKDLLTEEQFTKWQKMAPGNRRPPGGGPGGPAGDKPAAGGDNSPKN